jgi:hypothetical protein
VNPAGPKHGPAPELKGGDDVHRAPRLARRQTPGPCDDASASASDPSPGTYTCTVVIDRDNHAMTCPVRSHAPGAMSSGCPSTAGPGRSRSAPL